MSFKLLLKVLFSRKVVTSLLLVQLAMTLALLLNSVLLAQQTHQQLHQPTGLDLDDIIQVNLKPTSPSLRVYPALENLFERQMEAVRNINGVIAVAYANQSPLQQGGNNGNIYVDGKQDLTNIAMVPMFYVSPDFFKVLGTNLLDGELPTHSVSLDDAGNPPLVITKRLANKLFNAHNAVGQETNRGAVTAVVADFYGQRSADDVMYNSVYVAKPYSVDWGYSLLVRTMPGSAETVRAQLAEILRNVEPNIEIFSVQTLFERHQLLYRNEYGLAMLLALLSALMLLVTMVSSYSSTHFHALKRQQEIGIKRALGASKTTILLELLSENWLCTAIGALLGTGFAFLLNQTLAKVISIPALYALLPLLASLALLLCVTVATWYPAVIATRISPATATKTL